MKKNETKKYKEIIEAYEYAPYRHLCGVNVGVTNIRKNKNKVLATVMLYYYEEDTKEIKGRVYVDCVYPMNFFEPKKSKMKKEE